MCGIIGIVSGEAFTADVLLSHLKRLEYRGYDSFGYAADTGASRKDVGHIVIADGDAAVEMRAGIAHTRWATHGGVTVQNAHPHTVGRVTLVHNGIIENHEMLGANDGLRSETDSERIAARVAWYLEDHPPGEAVRKALADCVGTWAIACIIDGEPGIFVARKDAPLIIGKTDTGFMISSDVRGISGAHTIWSMDDGTVAHVTHDGIHTSSDVIWEPNTLEAEAVRPEGTAMEYEILETPDALSRVERMEDRLQDCTIIGCGSSINAASIGASLADARATILLASEYDPGRDPSPCILAISQSGETADVLDAVKRAASSGKRIVALVNTPHSSLTRLADTVYELHAGEERCVAATKSCTLQAVMVAGLLGKDVRADAIKGARAAIDARATIAETAQAVAPHHDVFLLARSSHQGLAQELALKLKEIAYQHAEAVQALELKHGPLALVTDGTPLIVLGDPADARLDSAMHESRARGGEVIPWFLGSDPAAVFAALVAGQLLTYEVARIRGTPIDHPRNLAKSVTVF